METLGHRSPADGVGVAYHPFLHDYLLDSRALFDFVELPMDLYLDEARSGLLDPGQRRLRQVTGAVRCTWRGSALSLGAVPPSGAPAFPPHTVRRICGLLALAPHAPYTEAVGVRAAGGPLHAVALTPAVARCAAARQAAACEALGVPVRLCLPREAVAAPAGEDGAGLDAAGFLALVAACGGTSFVLDTADLAGAEPHDAARRLAGVPIAALSVSSDDPAAWDALAVLAGHLAPGAVVLRRDRQLFPLETIGRDLSRAAGLLSSAAPRTPAGPLAPSDPRSSLSGTARAPPTGPAHTPDAVPDSSPAWRHWRKEVDDMHKGQQIMALMSGAGMSGAGPRPPGSPPRQAPR